MFRYTCLNPISQKGLELFSDQYTEVKELAAADAVLVRSAKMTELEIPDSVLAIGRAGAGVNNIPVADCAEKILISLLRNRRNSLQAVRLAVKSWELSVWVRLAPWWQMLRML